MNSQIFLSRFTPSLMTPDVLERIFVQRGDMAEHLVGIVRESVRTPAKHHTLVLGPRGIGKTHLLSLVHHRIAKQEDLEDRMRIAWLREEEWGVSSFLDLLHRILRTLSETYKDADLQTQSEKLFGLSTKVAERKAGDLLRSFLDGRTLVLMTENLDDVFSGLGKKEQHRFRAYLQEEESWTIVATAQGLFAGVSLHESPFYGFFEVHHLQELSVDDAVRLVINIARLSEDEELATFVQSPEGRARIRAIHHLAGGNHRVYVILSEFLTRATLDELVDPFLKAMDDLTPYYQARMAQLSSQQRKIVDFLCDTRGAVPVKQIAQRCFMTQQTASSQLKGLRDKGYVRSTSIGRDSYYELTEPLMRIALEVKKQREGPVRLFLDFLRYWYTRDELVERITYVQPHSILEHEYLQRVLETDNDQSDDTLLAEHLDQFYQHIDERDFNAALEVAARLVELRSDAGNWSLLGWSLYCLDRCEEAVNAADRAISEAGNDLLSWATKAYALVRLGRPLDALQALEQAIQLAHNATELARFYGLQGAVLRILGRRSEAVHSFDMSIQQVPDLYLAWRHRAYVLVEMEHYAEAVAALKQLSEHDTLNSDDWGYYARALAKLGRYEEALHSIDRQLASDPESASAWSIRGRILHQMERYEDAVKAFVRATDFGFDAPATWFEMGDTLNRLGRYDEALEVFRTAHQKNSDKVWARFAVARQLLLLSRYDEAARLVGNPDVSDEKQHLLVFEKVWVCCGLDLLEEARGILASLLGASSSVTADRSVMVPLIIEVARNPGGESVHRRWVSMLVETYVEYGVASQLAAGLVTAIPAFIPLKESHRTATEWLDLWREIAGPYPEFDMALRLFHAAVEYRKSGDERVLLALPAEERDILSEALGSTSLTQEMTNGAGAFGGAKQARRRRKLS